jgi:hypothetical protein
VSKQHNVLAGFRVPGDRSEQAILYHRRLVGAELFVIPFVIYPSGNTDPKVLVDFEQRAEENLIGRVKAVGSPFLTGRF